MKVTLRVHYDAHGDEEWQLHDKEEQSDPLVTASEEATVREMAASEGWDIVGKLVDARHQEGQPELAKLEPADFSETLVSTLTRNGWVVEKTTTWAGGERTSCTFRCRKSDERVFRDLLTEDILDMLTEIRSRGKGVKGI